MMSISNYEGTADTFTFPNNPNTFDDEIQSNHTITNLDYQRHHILVSGDGIAPKNLVLTGSFFGSSKNTNYQDLAKHFSQTSKLKKLYWETDKFYLGIGQSCKKTHSGGRTNFIDYVANFQTIVGILFSDTQKTYTNGGGDKENEGNTTTFIEEVSGVVTSGASDVTISDDEGNELTIPASALTTGQTIVVTFVKMVDSGDGIYVSEYNYTTIAGTQTNAVRTTDGFGILKLASGDGVSGNITTTNLNAGWTCKFRNGYLA
jgi:hypothetical protein